MTDENRTLTDEEIKALPPLPDHEERITFTFKKTHLLLTLLPVAFLLGLLAGYAAWGRAAALAAAAPIAAPAAVAQSAPQPATGQEITPPQDVPRYDIPIGANDPSFGPEDAAVTIVEFSDFECPYCRRHNLEVKALILAAYGDNIRYVFKDFPLTSIHPNAIPAAEAAHCADEQGQFWAYHERLFSMELGLSPASYLQYAETLGLDMESFTLCVEERRYAAAVQEDYAFAANLGVRSTPTFFINGLAVVGAQPFEVFAQVIEAELAGQ